MAESYYFNRQIKLAVRGITYLKRAVSHLSSLEITENPGWPHFVFIMYSLFIQ